MTPRIGILGGTFDPFHCGHLDLATVAERALNFTDVLVVPLSRPPHRLRPVASSFHRFTMAALAALGRPRWRMSDLELRREAISYTADTLDALHQTGHAPTELFFIVGADAFAEVTTWKDYPVIFDRAHFVVVSRGAVPASQMRSAVPALAPRMCDPVAFDSSAKHPWIFLLDAVTADVSASAIRVLRGQGLPITGLVPPSVEQYIEQHDLYASSPDAQGPRDEGHDIRHHRAGRLHDQD